METRDVNGDVIMSIIEEWYKWRHTMLMEQKPYCVPHM